MQSLRENYSHMTKQIFECFFASISNSDKIKHDNNVHTFTYALLFKYIIHARCKKIVLDIS